MDKIKKRMPLIEDNSYNVTTYIYKSEVSRKVLELF